MTEQGVFRALSDPTRRAIIGLLAKDDLNLNEIAANFAMTRPAVKKHVGILKEGGVVTITARGRERIHSLRPQALKSAADWINTYSRFWDENLEQLKQAVESDDE